MKTARNHVEQQVERTEGNGGYGQAHQTARQEDWFVLLHGSSNAPQHSRCFAGALDG